MQEMDSLHQLKHVRLHSLIWNSMLHQFHVMEEGSVHELKYKVQLAICVKALQEGH